MTEPAIGAGLNRDRAVKRPLTGRRLFLTGANGFIGRHLAAAAAAGGWEVTALILPGSSPEGLASARILEGNLATGTTWVPELEGHDLVINLAGRMQGCNPADYRSANVQTIERLAEALAGMERPPRLIHVSSVAALGPVVGGSSPPAEDAVCRPVSLYGRSKRQGERALLARVAVDSVGGRSPDDGRLQEESTGLPLEAEFRRSLSGEADPGRAGPPPGDLREERVSRNPNPGFSECGPSPTIPVVSSSGGTFRKTPADSPGDRDPRNLSSGHAGRDGSGSAQKGVPGRLPPLGTLIVRPCSVYGAGDPCFFDLFKLATQGVFLKLATRHKRFQLIEVGDLVRQLLRLADPGGPTGLLHIGNPTVVTDDDLRQALGRAVGKTLRTVFVPPGAAGILGRLYEWLELATGRPQLMSRSKIAEMSQEAWLQDFSASKPWVGDLPLTDLESGIGKTYQWYREHKWL